MGYLGNPELDGQIRMMGLLDDGIYYLENIFYDPHLNWWVPSINTNFDPQPSKTEEKRFTVIVKELK
jgi:hypothetical protein